MENTFSNHLINSGISWGLGKIVAAIGGPWGAVVGVAFWAISTYDAWMQSQSPYPYYITDTYIHLGQRKWKFVIRFYKNSDYTGYVKTETKYANF
ncbi:hypothetical protein PFZ59_01740 [Streptococcus suis]|uniref:hypothetical protein n=1 Tax=Streptococcus suis TaxID=1307 RepID=UPI00240E497B|nr:hypothetical protein [Streptococcus suis]WFA76238.1 hypothetical protein PFZ59_01740 [Streptococcus suis]